MKNRLLLAFLLVATLAVAACGDKSVLASPPTTAPAAATSSTAATTVTAPASAVVGWDALQADVGKYPPDIDLYEHSPISAALKALLDDRFDAFTSTMQESGPLQLDGVLYVTGNKPHQGSTEAGYLRIDPATQQLEVGLW